MAGQAVRHGSTHNYAALAQSSSAVPINSTRPKDTRKMSRTLAEWLLEARTVMALWLLLAGAFIVGHDRFYASLDGKQPSTQYFSQQHNNSIGTAFAFCVKSALGVAISTAYAQCLWRVLLKNKLPISKIDTLSTLTISALRMTDLSLPVQFPVLFGLALVYWTISITVIFPPGALTVAQGSGIITNTSAVPFVDWDRSLLYLHEVGALGIENQNVTGKDAFEYELRPIASAATLASYLGSLGEIPPIQPPVLNSTFHHNFYAPVLECSSRIWQGPVAPYCNLTGGDVSIAGFAGWPDSRPPSISQYLFGLPADASPGSSEGVLNCEELSYYQTAQESTFFDTTPQLYIAAFQGINGSNQSWSITQCQLANATYSADFSFINGKQDINITTSSNHALPQPISSVLYHGNGSDDSTLADYDIGIGRPGNGILNFFSMMALMRRITNGLVDSQSSLTVPPAIFNTRLAFTQELQTFNQSVMGNSSVNPELWARALGASGGIFAGSANLGPLAPRLEEFFRNLTIAVMTSSDLGVSQDLTYQVLQPVEVYSYDWRHLWTAYGVGLGISACIVMIGFLTIISHGGAAYSNKFSTYLRTIPPEEISSLIHSEDASRPGAEPLPKEVASMKLWLGMSKHPNYASPTDETKHPIVNVGKVRW